METMTRKLTPQQTRVMAALETLGGIAELGTIHDLVNQGAPRDRYMITDATQRVLSHLCEQRTLDMARINGVGAYGSHIVLYYITRPEGTLAGAMIDHVIYRREAQYKEAQRCLATLAGYQRTATELLAGNYFQAVKPGARPWEDLARLGKQIDQHMRNAQSYQKIIDSIFVIEDGKFV